MDRKKFYKILTLICFIISIIILIIVDKTNNVNLSLAIQIILILYLSKITYGCIIFVQEQYKKIKYSYSIIMNLGLILFLIINIFRQITLLIINFGKTSIIDIYNTILESFSYFAILVLPCIVIISAYCVISNIILIKKEGFSFSNLLGIFLGILTIICLFSGQIVYFITNTLNLNESQIILKRFIDISLNAVLSYFYCLILATLYCNIMAARHKPKYDKDFVIILGSQINKDGTLTPLLKARADKAISFYKEQKEETNKDIIFVPSGGKGKDEVISEGEAIKKYLIQQGINKENIIVENNSKSTLENMKFSKAKIDEYNKKGNIIFSTTNYHVFRSGVIANREGIHCEGIGSSTKWYFYTNALIREFLANLFVQRYQHFILITSINIVLLFLVFVGMYI